mgnify:CR=1 FL=1
MERSITMKKITILLIGVTILLFSCKKDLDQPGINEFPTGNVWTVGQILDTLANGTFQFDKEWHQNAVVKGYVIADETGGNIYRTFYLRGEDGRCIAVYRKGSGDGGSESFNVKTGDHIGYSLYGSIISEYSKLPQIQVQEYDPNKLIVIYERGCYDMVQPVSTTIEDVNAGEHLCDLVKLSDVQFESYQGLTYAANGTTTNRNLVSCAGESIIVRTSGYASFAEEYLPEGRGALTSIVSLYNTTWQLLLRNTSDVDMNEKRCGEGGDLMELPYTQYFTSSFGTYTTYNVAGDQTWIIDYETAKMSGKEGSEFYENEDWLISSPVEITGVEHAKAIVNYVAQYNGPADDVTIRISSDYVYGENPADYNWTKLEAEFSNTGGWSDFQDITISLDEYIGDTVTIAIKFISSATQSRTIEIKSISIEDGEPAPTPQVIFQETFGQSQGDFIINDVFLSPELSFVWKFSSSYGMVASAFTNNTSYASESWLISPSIDMSEYTNAVMTFDHAANKLNNGSPADYYFVMVSTDYEEGMEDDATWTQLEVPTYPAGNSWTFVSSGSIDMTAYLGHDNVHIAFKYTSENGNSGSWEIKNVLISE